MKIANAPEGHFLALIQHGATAMPLPIGCVILNIEDASRPDKITPMALLNSSLKKLTFRCACGQPKCTRVMEYHLKAKGHHPPRMYGT